MRQLTLTGMVLLMLGVVLNSPVFAQTERAAKLLFEERYGLAFRKAIASRTTEDDVVMAGELLAVAQATVDNAPLVADICDNVFLLASRDVNSHDIAIEAMNLLATSIPEKATASREKVVAFLRRYLLTAKGEERLPTATRLIAVLTRQGDDLAAASDFGGAAKIYAQAYKIAEDEKITDVAPLKTKLDAAAAREKLEARIEVANVKLATDPSNATAAAELFQIYLVERDDPKQAMRYLEVGGSATAKRLLPLVNGVSSDLTAVQCVDIAEWFETLSLDAPATSKAAIIKRSRTYYEQFLLFSNVDKLLQLKTGLAIKRLREAWVRANSEEAKSLAPVDDNGWADMLAGIEPIRYRLSGKWRRGEEGFVVSASVDPARMMLPGVVAASYELTARFTRLTGEGPVVFILPVRDSQVRLVLSGWNGKASGLYSLGIEAIDPETGIIRNTSTVLPGTLTNEMEYSVAVRTIIKGDTVTFAIDLAGERYIDWTGSLQDLKLDPAWSLREHNAFGLGAMAASVQFSEVKLRSLQGDVVLMPKPSTLAERGVVTPADGFVDLTEIWDAGKDIFDGRWVRELDALVTDRAHKMGVPRTRMPVLPEGNYTLRTRFTCLDNKRSAGGPVLFLPIQNTRVMLVMGAGLRGNLAGLSNISGKDATNNETTVPTSLFEVDKKYLLETRVLVQEDQASIEADLDGKKLIRWKGPVASLAGPVDVPLGDGKSPGIGSHHAEFSFETVEMRMDTGSAPLVRQPAKMLVVDTTPVDLLKLIDTRKHSYAGPWTLEGGKLSTMTVTTSTIMLPIVPSGSYEFRTKFMRSGGRPTVNIYLPVPGGSFDLALGANDGRTCALSVIPIKGDPPTNVVSNSNVRVVNNTLYSVRVKIESKASKTHIWVELDGKPYLEWQGPTENLRASVLLPLGFNTRAPGIVVSNLVARSGATFTDLEVKMISGSSKKLE